VSESTIDPALLRAVRYDEGFLEHSWDWLSDPEVRELTGTPAFTKDAQAEWFRGLAEKSDYLIWGLSYAHRPIGAFGLKGVTSTEAEYWGYIGEKEFWGRGIGSWMIEFSVDEGRQLGLERLYLRVLSFNERAIRLYRKHGFDEAGKEGQLIRMVKELYEG
jgi:RimJ/RimL family protein N-acetyltransferase